MLKATHPRWYEGHSICTCSCSLLPYLMAHFHQIPYGYDINLKYPDAIHSAMSTRWLQKLGQFTVKVVCV
jgi:hypothetical protein